MSVRMLTLVAFVPFATGSLLGLTGSVGGASETLGMAAAEVGVEVTIREGTNMAAAVSPDGSTLSEESGPFGPMGEKL